MQLTRHSCLRQREARYNVEGWDKNHYKLSHSDSRRVRGVVRIRLKPFEGYFSKLGYIDIVDITNISLNSLNYKICTRWVVEWYYKGVRACWYCVSTKWHPVNGSATQHTQWRIGRGFSEDVCRDCTAPAPTISCCYARVNAIQMSTLICGAVVFTSHIHNILGQGDLSLSHSLLSPCFASCMCTCNTTAT